jgi:hypothetical protein
VAIVSLLFWLERFLFASGLVDVPDSGRAVLSGVLKSGVRIGFVEEEEEKTIRPDSTVNRISHSEALARLFELDL